MAYLPLSTANLPDPAIDPAQGSSPEDYFAPAIWSGDNTSPRTIPLDFTPDFIWTKSRSSASSHFLYDTVRGLGADQDLSSDKAQAEGLEDTDVFGYVDSSGGTGFNVVAGSSNRNFVNETGRTYVAWNWKANGSGVSNTDGTITSTVSANTTSGFSIVSYTGTGSDVLVGHGLDQKPQMIITKNRDGAYSWTVTHFQMNGGSAPADNGRMYLNSTDGYGVGSGLYDYAEFTDTVYSINGGDHNLNYSGEDYIAYVFHSVEGFSKFGSYTGNGSTDGPFVYCGFRPAWVLIMCSSASANHPLADNARDTYNPAGTSLFPETTDGDNSKSGREFDLLSNGFKIRNGNGEKNSSGATYIYMAFAENPFKYSNAR